MGPHTNASDHHGNKNQDGSTHTIASDHHGNKNQDGSTHTIASDHRSLNFSEPFMLLYLPGLVMASSTFRHIFQLVTACILPSSKL